MALIDDLVIGLDRALRTIAGAPHAQRESPAATVHDSPLSDGERTHAAGLMRVNHTGEICAGTLRRSGPHGS